MRVLLWSPQDSRGSRGLAPRSLKGGKVSKPPECHLTLLACPVTQQRALSSQAAGEVTMAFNLFFSSGKTKMQIFCRLEHKRYWSCVAAVPGMCGQLDGVAFPEMSSYSSPPARTTQKSEESPSFHELCDKSTPADEGRASGPEQEEESAAS